MRDKAGSGCDAVVPLRLADCGILGASRRPKNRLRPRVYGVLNYEMSLSKSRLQESSGHVGKAGCVLSYEGI